MNKKKCFKKKIMCILVWQVLLLSHFYIVNFCASPREKVRSYGKTLIYLARERPPVPPRVGYEIHPLYIRVRTRMGHAWMTGNSFHPSAWGLCNNRELEGP
ncbi:hypothetical protein PUN28_001501 [Cardiocondyla obscurior]|uniref:Secreted protein n=1 Tax=Cardiocondyla obscurior TaxID=286306 RepID=A0AAW2H5M5_9HYME